MKQFSSRRKGSIRVGALILAITLVLAIGTGCGKTSATQTQPAVKYPTRPINVIVGFGAGGGADQLARLMSKELGQSLKVSLPVVNMAGAAGGVGMTKLTTEPADGYNICVYPSDAHSTLASANAGWKLEDFTGVARMIKAPNFLFVAMNDPIKTWADLEKKFKDNPGKLKVAGAGEGSLDNVIFKYLDKNQGIKVNSVPYANPGERYTSIIGGHADVLFEQAGDVKTYVDQKQMRPVLVFSETRAPQFPDVQCSKEVGINIFLPYERYVIAKAGTSAEQIKILSDSLKKVYDTSPDFIKFLKDNYCTPDTWLGPEDATKNLQQSVLEMKKINQ